MGQLPNGRRCQRCGRQLVGRQRLWCSHKCTAAASSQKRRDEEKLLKPKGVAPGARGKLYRYLNENPVYLAEMMSGQRTIPDVAREFSIAHSTAARNFNAVLAEQNIDATAWTIDPDVAQMLGLDHYEPPDDPAELDSWLDSQVEGFARFRTRFFRVKRGRPYLTEDFHRRWIKEILRAIVTGSKLLILSPPRHGKSELLGHFCVWLICRDHDMRIIWVGGNADIAADMVASVRDHLEENSDLVASVLPPGQTFKPEGKQGVVWQNQKFRVAQRSLGLKGNTMVAVGRTGKILSRDADFIVSDDIEDHESTSQPHARAATRSWFTTTLDSRKEEHTGWVAIGSRQHHDDLYGYLLGDDEWQSIVDSAHQDNCPHPPDQEDQHQTCMLFPALRTYRWLMAKRRSAAALGLEGHWEMVYLNVPRIEGLQIFVREHLEQCFNYNRDVGTAGTPDDLQLVAGLDPAATGFQAGWIWGWSPETRKLYLVDLDNRAGGGIDAFLTLADNWYRRYRLAHWVIEDKGFQSAYRQEDRVREWAADHNVFLEGHHTGTNKADPHFGVGSMANLYEKQKADLPYGTVGAREKTMLYVRQALRFVDEPVSSNRRNRAASDILMASWFPMKVVRRWQKEQEAIMDVQYQPSYTGWDISDINETPW